MMMKIINSFYPAGFWQYELLFIFRLILALVLGGMIGVERQWKKGSHITPAGLRTHILVALGACIFTMVSIMMPLIADVMGGGIVNNADPGRIAAQVVSGIGFIGAGAILQSKGRIRGLTTAASLWVSAAIGVAVGVGLYLTAIAATFVTLITLRWFSSLEVKADKMMAKRTLCYSEKECEKLADEIGAENVLYIDKQQLKEYRFEADDEGAESDQQI